MILSYSTGNYQDAPLPLKDYLFYLLTIKGRSRLTVENYYLDLRTFLRFMKQFKGLADPKKEPEEIDISDLNYDFLESITLSDVYEFLHYIYDDRDNNPRTRARKASALRGFFKYLCNITGKLKTNPVENLEMPTLPKTLPKYLTLEQSLELLQTANHQGAASDRDYCMVVLFLNCGIRLSELTGLRLSDISLSEKRMTVLGKGNKQRMLYLNDACVDALNRYLESRLNIPNIVDKNALFLNRSGKRLGQRRVQQIITSLLQQAGLADSGFSTHKLRHTAATMMYQYGKVDVRVLQEILGHENLNTTEIYTHVANEQKEEALSKNPLGKVKMKPETEKNKA